MYHPKRLFRVTLISASLFLLLLYTNVQYTNAQARSIELQRTPPVPLPRGCVSLGTDINEEETENPVCCVGGYVYLNGQPVEGAELTISANGQTRTVRTAIQHGRALPHFAEEIHTEDLNVHPSDVVTLTARMGDLERTVPFNARAGGQQVDVILPIAKTDSAWTPSNIVGRHDHAMTYDTVRQRVVLFGGIVRGTDQYLNDTWEWNGTFWVQRTTPHAPPARRGHALVYDGAREEVILFGGQDAQGSFRYDTWAWDGTSWHQITPDNGKSPEARAHHALAYDSERQEVLLFGGGNEEGLLDDVLWIWNGRQWEERFLDSTPPIRLHHDMVYDMERKRIVLFGGQVTSDEQTSLLADTWEWNGTRWIERAPPTSPPGLIGHSMAYDVDLQRTLLLGGRNHDGESTADMWMWQDGIWEKLQIADAPPPRLHHAMSYDIATQQLFLFGGTMPNDFSPTDFADTWTWDGVRWLSRSEPAPFIQWLNLGMARTAADQLLIFGGRPSGIGETPSDHTYLWQFEGWQQLTSTVTPAGRYGHRLASNQDGTNALMVGGIGEDDLYLDDTWLWNGQDWIALHTDTYPPARAFHGLTYDTARNVWMLFGGRGPSGDLFNDLWEYDGMTWSLRTSDTSPSIRYAASLTYDASRQRTILFGGTGVDGDLNDVWEWDGDMWQTKSPKLVPEARSGHGAIYAPDQGGIIIAGGFSSKGALDDTWLWDGTEWRRWLTQPKLPPLYNLTMDRFESDLNDDPIGQIVSLGGQLTGDSAFFLFRSFEPTTDAHPVATINYLNPPDAEQGKDSIEFEGSGADADDSNEIVAYRWSHNEKTLSTDAAFTLPAVSLPIGTQSIQFAVKDNEGNWSEVVTRNLIIRRATANDTLFLPLTIR